MKRAVGSRVSTVLFLVCVSALVGGCGSSSPNGGQGGAGGSTLGTTGAAGTVVSASGGAGAAGASAGAAGRGAGGVAAAGAAGVVGTGAGGVAGAAGGSGRSGSAGTGAAGSGGLGGATGGTAGAGGANCGVQTFTAAAPADVLVLLDRSASMQDGVQDQTATGGTNPSKWSQVVPALTQVTTAADGSVRWGLKTFPEDDSANECSNDTLTTRIDVPVAAMNAATVDAAITTATPNGNGTPLAAAIDVASAYLQTLNAADPKYILLVTDGNPTCAGTLGALTLSVATAGTSAVASVMTAATAGVHTFVVGLVGAAAPATDTMTLNALANAGGEPPPSANPLAPRFYQALTTDDLTAVLQTITDDVVGCSFPLATPPPFPNDVAVGVAGTAIPRDPSNTNGWNYTDGTNSSLRLFGSWCDSVSTTGRGAIRIVYGCS